MWIFISLPLFRMDTKKKKLSLWEIMYGPQPNREQQSELPGPLFDFTVLALGVVGAIGYVVLNLTR